MSENVVRNGLSVLMHGLATTTLLTSAPNVHSLFNHTNQAAIIALFRVVNRYVGNLQPMPGAFPDYPAPVIRNTEAGRGISYLRAVASRRLDGT